MCGQRLGHSVLRSVQPSCRQPEGHGPAANVLRGSTVSPVCGPRMDRLLVDEVHGRADDVGATRIIVPTDGYIVNTLGNEGSPWGSPRGNNVGKGGDDVTGGGERHLHGCQHRWRGCKPRCGGRFCRRCAQALEREEPRARSPGTSLLETGAELIDIQTLLGHVELATTQIYIHISEDRIAGVVAKLEESLQIPRVTPGPPMSTNPSIGGIPSARNYAGQEGLIEVMWAW